MKENNLTKKLLAMLVILVGIVPVYAQTFFEVQPIDYPTNQPANDDNITITTPWGWDETIFNNGSSNTTILRGPCDFQMTIPGVDLTLPWTAPSNNVPRFRVRFYYTVWEKSIITGNSSIVYKFPQNGWTDVTTIQDAADLNQSLPGGNTQIGPFTAKPFHTYWVTVRVQRTRGLGGVLGSWDPLFGLQSLSAESFHVGDCNANPCVPVHSLDQNNLTPSDIFFGTYTPLYEASDFIEIDNFTLRGNSIAASERLHLDAENRISIRLGFNAEAGSDFRAWIDGCDNRIERKKQNQTSLISSNSTELKKAEELDVFPNPFNDRLRVKGNYTEVSSIQVLDLSGRLLLEKTGIPEGDFNLELDLSQYPKGVYFLQSITPNSRNIKKIVKSN